jgi:hypothetical protein
VNVSNYGREKSERASFEFRISDELRDEVEAMREQLKELSKERQFLESRVRELEQRVKSFDPTFRASRGSARI